MNNLADKIKKDELSPVYFYTYFDVDGAFSVIAGNPLFNLVNIMRVDGAEDYPLAKRFKDRCDPIDIDSLDIDDAMKTDLRPHFQSKPRLPVFYKVPLVLAKQVHQIAMLRSYNVVMVNNFSE